MATWIRAGASTVAVVVAAAFTCSAAAQDMALSPATADPMAPAGSTRSAPQGASAGKATLAASDRRFIEKAAQSGLADVALGRLAEQRAGADRVKLLGGRMTEDQGKANAALKRIAEAKGVAWPTDSDAAVRRTIDRLAELSGPEFDQAFLKEMLADYRKNVGEFKSAARSARDPDVKTFAESTLLMLQELLSFAQSIESAMGSTGADRERSKPARSPGSAPPPSTRA